MPEQWTTLPSGSKISRCDSGFIVQKTSDSARIVQAVLVTWEDIATLAALKARCERRALLPEGWEMSA